MGILLSLHLSLVLQALVGEDISVHEYSLFFIHTFESCHYCCLRGTVNTFTKGVGRRRKTFEHKMSVGVDGKSDAITCVLQRDIAPAPISSARLEESVYTNNMFVMK